MGSRLGTKIKQARARVKLNGADLARRAEVPYGWLRQVEAGGIDRPDAVRLRKIAAHIPMDVDEMLALSDQLGETVTPTAPDQAALLRALTRQAEAIEALVAVLAHREGISPSALPPGVRELAARLVGEERALQGEDDEEGTHRAAAS